jgi:hypothetical protein
MLRAGTVILGLCLRLAPATALAHADGEWTVATVPDPAGGVVRLALHTTDGIVQSDPRKLMIYDEDGKVLAETPYTWDTLVGRGSDGVWRAFAVNKSSLLFRRAWALRGRGLIADRSWRGYVEGVRLVLRGRGWAYAVSIGICVLGIVTWLRKSRRLARESSDEFQATGCGCLAYFWMFVLWIYTPINMPPILIGSLLLSLPWTRGREERRAVLGLLGGPLVLLLLVNAIDVAASAIRG